MFFAAIAIFAVGLLYLSMRIGYNEYKKAAFDGDYDEESENDPDEAIELSRFNTADLEAVVHAAESQASESLVQMDDFLRSAGLEKYIDSFHDFGLESLEDLADPDIITAESLQSQIGLTDEEVDIFYDNLNDDNWNGVTTTDAPVNLEEEWGEEIEM